MAIKQMMVTQFRASCEQRTSPVVWPVSDALTGHLVRHIEFRTSCLLVNGRGCETLNALFGAACDRTTLNPDPQLGNFGQPNERRFGPGHNKLTLSTLLQSIPSRIPISPVKQ
jgi:hypothetical protein